MEETDLVSVRRNAMKVITISGKAQNGKDTTAGFLKDALEADGYSVLITHYGDLLKYICQKFFNWNGEKDEKGRSLLQYVGTDVIRAKSPNYWADFIVNFFSMFQDEWDYVILPDCRFPNEYELFKYSGIDTPWLSAPTWGHILFSRNDSDMASLSNFASAAGIIWPRW